MKKITILILSLLILIGAYIVYSGNNKTTISNKEANFAIADTSLVTKIFLADKAGNTVTLKRKGNDWTVNDTFPANQDVIRYFLRNLSELKVKSPVPKAMHKGIFTSMASQAVKIEIYAIRYRIDLGNNFQYFPYESKNQVYYVGGPTPDNSGSYMLMEGASKPYIVHILGLHGYVSTLYTALTDKWRSHTIFNTKFQNIASVSVEFPDKPQDSYTVSQDDNHEFSIRSLSDNKTLPAYDTLKMYNFVTSFADLRFEAFRNELPEKDSIINNIKPLHIITLMDQNGQTFQVKTFPSPNLGKKESVEGDPYTYDVDRMFALVNNEKDFVLIQYYVFDKIIKPLDYYKIN
jgi:hypothetical protein